MRHRHFAAGALALALYIFGKLGATAAEAARRIGCLGQGPGAWRSLRRWIAAIDAGRLFPCVRGSPSGWPPRKRAERAAMAIGARVPWSSAMSDAARVFAGAALAG